MLCGFLDRTQVLHTGGVRRFPKWSRIAVRLFWVLLIWIAPGFGFDVGDKPIAGDGDLHHRVLGEHGEAEAACPVRYGNAPEDRGPYEFLIVELVLVFCLIVCDAYMWAEGGGHHGHHRGHVGAGHHHENGGAAAHPLNRPLLNAASAMSRTDEDDACSIRVGARVEAVWTDRDSGESAWFDATVAGRNADGSYRVVYADGDSSERVPVNAIRLR